MTKATSNPYETEALVSQYLAFHYADADDYFPYASGPREALGFPVRCVSEIMAQKGKGPLSRALDIGCAVGRSSFELARHFPEVVGIDYSEAFIRAANELRKTGQMEYALPVAGECSRMREARVPSGIDRRRVSFRTGDAQALSPDLGRFDCVLACNLICRLREPRALLRRLPDLVNPGGILLITTPYSWLETYTPPENWLEASDASGHTCEGLRRELEPDFSLLQVKDMPMLIREHARKFQYTMVQASLWKAHGG